MPDTWRFPIRRRRRDNSYLRMLKHLSSCTQGLMLLTATPMQIDPSELWALLQTLDTKGQWNEAEFRRFYDIDAQPTLGGVERCSTSIPPRWFARVG